MGARGSVAATCSRAMPPPSGATACSGPGGARGCALRAADGCCLARYSGRDGGLLGVDGVASAAGLDRGRGPALSARRPVDRAAPGGPSGAGRLRRGRVACPGSQRGDHVGPSSVDRVRPGSKHCVIVDRRGTPLAITLTGGTATTSPSSCRCSMRSYRFGGRRGRPPPQASASVRRPRLRLRQVPPPAVKARHQTDDRPTRRRPRLRAGQSALGSGARLRLAAPVQTAPHSLRTTRRCPFGPAPAGLRSHLPSTPPQAVLRQSGGQVNAIGLVRAAMWPCGWRTSIRTNAESSDVVRHSAVPTPESGSTSRWTLPRSV